MVQLWALCCITLLQIRAHTDLAGEGNWSQTVIISDKFLSTEQTCSTTTTPSTSRKVQGVEKDSGGTQESSSVYIPVVISAGAVLVLILLVLLTIVTVKCGRIRRRKRRIRHVLAKQVYIYHILPTHNFSTKVKILTFSLSWYNIHSV